MGWTHTYSDGPRNGANVTPTPPSPAPQERYKGGPVIDFIFRTLLEPLDEPEMYPGSHNMNWRQWTHDLKNAVERERAAAKRQGAIEELEWVLRKAAPMGAGLARVVVEKYVQERLAQLREEQ